MIYDIVFKKSKDILDRISLKSKGKSISYRELQKCILNFAFKLHLNGFKNGDKLLILLPNSNEFVISFFGASILGGVPVLADIKYNNELSIIIKENLVKWIVTNNNQKSKINTIIDQLDDIDTKSINILEAENEELFYGKDTISLNNNITIEDIAMILYTSGSTGRPKGVVNSHKTLQEALKNYTETVDIRSTDKLVAVSPFFHSYAFGSCMLAGLSSGASLLIEDSFQPRKILNLIEKEKATIFHGVPYMYKLINEQLVNKKYDCSSLRLCISAGGILSEEVAKLFYQYTSKIIHQEYGSSETGTIAINLSSNVELNINSVGKPLNNVQVELIQKNDNEIIHIKSLGCSLKYVNGENFNNDCFNTGDIGKFDDEKNIYIIGREKKMINVAGLKVNPTEVEMELLKNPEVSEVLVRGFKDSDFGEVVEALVVRKNSSLTEQALIRMCQTKIAAYKIPKIIRWVDELPKSGTGKITAKAGEI